MTELALDVLEWLSVSHGPPEERATMASFRVRGGSRLQICLSEVEDTVARTVRPHVYVPAHAVAEWILANWWRLRWEGRRRRPDASWRFAHTLSAVGGDHAWPSLEFASDGAFVELSMESEPTPDSAGIRYLSRVTLPVAVEEFEEAVDRFVDSVDARLNAVLPGYRTLQELRSELADERTQPSLASACRRQAISGMDPGSAPDGWLELADRIAADVGPVVEHEVLSTVPELEEGITTAERVLEAMKRSSTAVDLTWVPAAAPAPARELPWQRGSRLAQDVRSRLGVRHGPVASATLAEALATPMPLEPEQLQRGALAGGMRGQSDGERTRILVTSRRCTSQRFYLARLIGAAMVVGRDVNVLPVTDSGTAMQKFERAFAQELLCPWHELDALTDQFGTGEAGVAEAADHFEVSEWLVLTTLVNRGKLSRDRLPTG